MHIQGPICYKLEHLGKTRKSNHLTMETARIIFKKMQNKLVSTKIHGCLAIKYFEKLFPGKRYHIQFYAIHPSPRVASIAVRSFPLLQIDSVGREKCGVEKRSRVPRILQTHGASRESAPLGSRTPGHKSRKRSEQNISQNCAPETSTTRSNFFRTDQRWQPQRETAGEVKIKKRPSVGR